MKTIEEMLGREDTQNLKEEYKTSLKINKYGGEEDAKAWQMLDELKRKNISVSKHIRMLLALEFEGKILLPDEYAVKTGYAPYIPDVNIATTNSKSMNLNDTIKKETVVDISNPNNTECMEMDAFDGM